MDNRYVYFRMALVFLLIAGGGYAVFWSWTILYPFVIAFILSAFLQPFILLLHQQLKIPRFAATLLILLFFITLTAAMLTLFVAELIKGIQFLSAGIPGQFAQLSTHLINQTMHLINPIIAAIEKITYKLNINQEQSIEVYTEMLKEKITRSGMEFLNLLFDGITFFLAAVPTSITNILIIFLATFFICKDWPFIISWTFRLIPKGFSDRLTTIRFELKHTLKGLIKAQCTLVMISTAIIAAGLYFIQAPYILTITFLIAIVDFIPYIGTGAIFLPWIIYQFFSGEFNMTISLTILYMIVIITRQILEPKLLADHFGVPPILLLLTLFVGYQLFGGYGIILSPLVLMFIQTLHKTGVLSEITAFIKGN